MFELIFYVLFLLLFVFGAWSLFSSWQKIFGKAESIACKAGNSEMTHQSSAFQFDVTNRDPLIDPELDEEDEQDEHGDISQPSIVVSQPSVASDPAGMMEVPNAERQRIEREHRSILEKVLQEVLSEQLTPFEQIYVKYVERCNTQERGRRLDKSRVRDRVKVYLRELADEGKLKRVMKGREYFYVVAETGRW
ncbi:hypothetical protein C5S53_14370 [Methanophagales archaeon]|nr:hypothetical protein C5S53_14370 [Methanophagales archaeon]